MPSRSDNCAASTMPAADRFAVQPFAVTDTRFDRMAERVAEIEQRALACFELIGGDDLRP